MPVTPSDIEAAAARVTPYIRRTPLLDVAPHEFGTDRPVQLKLEFQDVYKTRPTGLLVDKNDIAFIDVAAEAAGPGGITRLVDAFLGPIEITSRAHERTALLDCGTDKPRYDLLLEPGF